MLVDLLINESNGGAAVGDRYFSIENVIGSIHDDSIFGDNGINRLDGYGGADHIYGRGGSDFLTISRGGDRLYGGEDSDTYIYSRSELSHDDRSTIIEYLNEGDSDTISFEDIESTNIRLTYEGDDLVISFRIGFTLGSTNFRPDTEIVILGGHLNANVELITFADGSQTDLAAHLAAHLAGEATESNDVISYLAGKLEYVGDLGWDLMDFSGFLIPDQANHWTRSSNQHRPMVSA